MEILVSIPLLSIETFDFHPELECGVVDAGIGQFNDQAAPLHEVKPLACVARSGGTTVMGGASGRRWGECAEIQQLWVAEHSRGLGVGSRLMDALETLARSHGCKSFFLETFSFQALDFYRKRGYNIAYENRLFPHGIVKYHMTKHVGD